MAKTQADQFTRYCEKLAKEAEDNELYEKAVMKVAAGIIEQKYGDEHLAQDVLDLVAHSEEPEDTNEW